MREGVIFLDRDGVISRELGDGKYICKWGQFRFIPGAIEAIRIFTEHQKTLLIISNQAGVGRGLVRKDQLNQVTKQMLSQIHKEGGRIAGVYYCVHSPQAKCLCRKPRVTLFRKAVKAREISWSKSIVVGDTLRDLQAGRRLKCRTVLVLSGKTHRREVDRWPFKPDHIAKNLLASVPWILEQR